MCMVLCSQLGTQSSEKKTRKNRGSFSNRDHILTEIQSLNSVCRSNLKPESFSFMGQPLKVVSDIHSWNTGFIRERYDSCGKSEFSVMRVAFM